MINVLDLFSRFGDDLEDTKYSEIVTGQRIVYQEGDDDEIEVFICTGIDESFFLTDETGEGYPPENCWVL